MSIAPATAAGGGGAGRRKAGGLLVYPEPGDVDMAEAREQSDPAEDGRALEAADFERQIAAHVDLCPRAVEDDADREPFADRKLELRPVALAVVELEPADSVEHRRVLHRVRVAVLVGAHVEGLEVAVTGGAPDRPVEAAVAVDGELHLDHTVEELDVADQAKGVLEPKTGPTEVLGRGRGGRFPDPA